jgi:hypothetical protein
MTDKELLELAAKAIGGTLSEGHTKVRTGETWDEWEWQGALGIQTGTDWLPHPGTTIHPLIDDGDALRLAVKLNLLSDPRFIHERNVLMFTQGIEKLEATRRAITRAAAAIGEGMKS